MDTFSVPIDVGDLRGERWQTVEALVDTGATYTQLPPELLAQLGIEPDDSDEFMTADGRVVERDLVEAVVRYDGRARRTIILVGEGGMSVLIGAYTLEGLRLGVDAFSRRLVPVRGWLA